MARLWRLSPLHNGTVVLVAVSLFRNTGGFVTKSPLAELPIPRTSMMTSVLLPSPRSARIVSTPPPLFTSLPYASLSFRRSARVRQHRQRKSEPDFMRPIYANRLHRFVFAVLVRIIVLATRFVLQVMNKTVLHDDKKTMENLILNRDEDVSLLTVSNHVSMADDPGIWCASLPFGALTPTLGRSIVMDEVMYYGLGPISAAIFHGCKCIPIRRGDLKGLESQQLAALHARLNGNVELQRNRKNEKKKKVRQWCHVMAEGRILQPWRFDPYGLPRLGRLRHGAAKLIACSPPSKTIVLPIFHDGLHQILPEAPPKNTAPAVRSSSGVVDRIPENRSGRTEHWRPRSGKRVDVFVGEPIDFSDLVPADGLRFDERVDASLLRAISDRLRSSLLKLEKRAAENRKKIEFYGNL